MSERTRRRRLLVLSPFAPRLDAVHGGARLIAESIGALSKQHDIALLCLRGEADPPVDDHLIASCDVVEEVVQPALRDGLAARGARSIQRLVSLARGKPLWVAAWWSARFAQRARALVTEWRPDVVQLEFHLMGQYVAAVADRGAPVVLVEHEPGYAAALERAREDRPGPRWLSAIDARVWTRYERALVTQVDTVVALTERDATTLAALSPRRLVRIRPGIRIPESPLSGVGTQPPAVLFVGYFAHPPNPEAALRLATRIHPRLRDAFPSVRLWLVGDGPPPALTALASDSIEVTGRVPDVTPYLDQAAVVVAPLTLGGGIRVKVLEALAAGKAVVASRLAVEGLAVVPGEHCLVADSDDETVAAIASLLGDAELRSRIGLAAREWAVRNLSWSRTVAEYSAMYEARLSSAAPAGGSVAARARPGAAADLTVAVATLDRPESLSRCLHALCTGTVRPAEIVVIDQGTSAATREVVQRQSTDALPIRYELQDRRGLSASRNAALSLATRPLLAVTDDDCVPDAGWVDAIVRAFDSDPTLAAVTGRVLPLGPETPDTFAVSSRTSTTPADYHGHATPWVVGTGANFAAPRERLLALGGFDERLGAGSAGGAGEDTDMLYRLLRAGGVVRYDPDAIVYHERQSRARRKSTRSSYGRGIGACCGLWLRGGNLYTVLFFGRWVASRLRRLVSATVRASGGAAYEEVLVLAGTLRGLVYGATVRRLPRDRNDRRSPRP